MNPLRVRGVVVALALAMTSTVPVLAQSSRTFPMLPHGADAQTGFPMLRPDAAAFGPLAQQSRVVLTGLLLPDGRTVDLDLQRLDLARLGFGFQVNGLPAPGLLSGLELSAWTGVVVGESGSEAVLSFSREGSFGWVTSGGEIVHLLPRAGAGGNWSAYEVLLARESELNEAGLSPGDFCGVDRLPPDARGEQLAPKSPHVPAKAEGGPDCTVLECAMAIETDFQLFQQFGSLGAETAYVTTLLAAISARYEEQIDTVLTFPYVQFYTTSGDPWSSPDGGDMFDVLDEFESAWAGSVPAGAVLGHFISGANLGGGVAYLGALCDTSQTFSFAVSGNVDGDTPFPIAVSPLNWDFMVVSHETGHNFNALHTHDYVPPIDNCAGGDCITNGTIMSYCHTCPGGMLNITTFFHPISVADMVAHASACLPLQAPLVADATAQPTLLPPGTATPLTVQVQGTPVGAVNLQYRLQPAGSFTAIPMTSLGGGTFGADLPAAQCGQQPEWFFSMVDATCGLFETPTFTAEVGVSTSVFADAFETSTGWSTVGPGDDATTGIWTRADPNGTGAQPENDISNPGTQCFFTGQGSPGGGAGDADVDGGQTTLTSPVLDLSAPGARIGYWRWYSNDTGSTPGTDIFVVDVSANGSTWVNAETVGPAGPGTSGGWIYHEFAVADFIAPSATGRVRFIASDEGSGSLVEAAVDEFEVFEVDCAGVCQTDLGFGGPGAAVLSLCGGDLSPGNPADLSLTGATPNGTAWMLVGLVFAPTPAKGGTIVPVPALLVQVQPLNGAGALGFPVGGVSGPLTIYVQYAYNLPSAPQGFGFSNALEVNIP